MRSAGGVLGNHGLELAAPGAMKAAPKALLSCFHALGPERAA